VKKNDVPCNLCGSTERNFLFDAKDRLHGYEGTFTYVQCKECGLVYMNPQVSADFIGELYPPDYGPHQTKPANRQQNVHALKTKLRKKPLIVSICNKLNHQSQLLDVGCGGGSFLNKVKMLTGCQV